MRRFFRARPFPYRAARPAQRNRSDSSGSTGSGSADSGSTGSGSAGSGSGPAGSLDVDRDLVPDHEEHCAADDPDGQDRRALSRGRSGGAAARGQPYRPQPVPRVPLAIELPPDYVDDPRYVLTPYATAGTSEAGGHVGVFGRMVRAGEKVAARYDLPFVHGYFGPPGYGKTYGTGCHIENVLMQTPYLNSGVRRQCVVSLHYEYGSSHAPDLLASLLPNQTPAEVERLVYEYGSLPQGLRDGVCLTLPKQVAEHRRQFPHWATHALVLPPRVLGIVGLKMLMGFPEQDETFYGAQLEAALGGVRGGLTVGGIEAALRTYDFAHRGVGKTLLQHFALARPHLCDACPSPRVHVREGRAICVDLRDGWISPGRAMRLLAALLYILFMSGSVSELPCRVVLNVDEFHKFNEYAVIAALIMYLVREHRHLGVSVMLSSQAPMAVIREVLDEADVVGLYRTDALRWLEYLARSLAAYHGVSVTEFLGMKPGQMMLWARRWFGGRGGELDHSPLVLMDVRPRLSQHGRTVWG